MRLARGSPQTSNPTHQHETRTLYHVLGSELRDPPVAGLLSPKFESPEAMRSFPISGATDRMYPSSMGESKTMVPCSISGLMADLRSGGA
jgi:hypothetical protein